MPEIIPLAPEPFVFKAACTNTIPAPMVIALDNQVAGIVYCFEYGQTLYWMNDLAVSPLKKAKVQDMNFDQLKAEISLKVALNHTSRTSLTAETFSRS